MSSKREIIWSNVALLAAGVAIAFGVSGCDNNDQSTDLKHVNFQEPDWIQAVQNVDKHPNIVQLCFNGLGYNTTTRDSSAAAMIRVPEMDAFCATQVKGDGPNFGGTR